MHTEINANFLVEKETAVKVRSNRKSEVNRRLIIFCQCSFSSSEKMVGFRFGENLI